MDSTIVSNKILSDDELIERNVRWIINLRSNDNKAYTGLFKNVSFPFTVIPPDNVWNSAWQRQTTRNLESAARYILEAYEYSDKKVLIVGDAQECVALIFAYLTILHLSSFDTIDAIIQSVYNDWHGYNTYFPLLFTQSILMPLIAGYDFIDGFHDL